jgi:hypothetical protein
VYLCTDGTCYDGHWKLGKKKGPGLLTLPNGDKIDGEWNDDEIVRAKYHKGNGNDLPM